MLATNTSNGTTTAYAVASDFCLIFAQNMNSLYVLSFLLTADRERAEQCFVGGLGDSVKANQVFREWARVVALPAFERFVFVMSVLERFSDQDCSILLGCSRQDVALARTQAAEHIASLAESSVPGAQGASGAFSQERWLAQSA